MKRAPDETSPEGERRWHEPGLLAGSRRFVQEDIWHVELRGLPTFRAWLTHASRVLLLTFRSFARHGTLQQAAALTYITIFSLPPVLAFAFSAAKGFGLYESLKAGTIDPFLDDTFGLRVAGEQVNGLREAVDQIFRYVETTNLKALGSFALVFMLYSVVRMMGAVEKSLNQIWGVKRARTLVRRMSDYLALVIVTPLFLILGATLSTLLRERILGLGPEAAFLTPLIRLTPVMAVWLGLAFAYLTLPNTSVGLPSALLGGVVAGTLWYLVQSLYVTGQLELARYNTIYASFAAIPMLLFWIYVSWVVFLSGAHLAFSRQHEPTYTSIQRTGNVDQAYRESLAPRIAGRVAAAFLSGEAAPTAAQLASQIGVAPLTVVEVLEELIEKHLLVRTSEDAEDRFVPARDPATITVVDLLRAMRVEGTPNPPPVNDELDERVDHILAAFEGELSRSPDNDTLERLARAGRDPSGAPGLRPPRSGPDAGGPGRAPLE